MVRVINNIYHFIVLYDHFRMFIVYIEVLFLERVIVVVSRNTAVTGSGNGKSTNRRPIRNALVQRPTHARPTRQLCRAVSSFNNT